MRHGTQVRVAILTLVCVQVLTASAVSAPQPLPIVDLHFHFPSGWDIGATVQIFDVLGVSRAGNGVKGGPDSLALEWARRYPDRFIPFAGKGVVGTFLSDHGEQAWNLQASSVSEYLNHLEAALRIGRFKGIGEIDVGARHLPIDSALMRRLWRLSATYGVPLSVDFRDLDQVPAMERLLASDRRGRWLWAHAGGSARPALLRRLFGAHPNLYCDLARRESRLTGSDWKALLEDFPSRCVVGTDVATLQRYVAVIRRWRAVLATLSPGTAAGVAYQNAEHLLRLSPTQR